jgi:two-component system, sensor histidine kinase and response regulator
MAKMLLIEDEESVRDHIWELLDAEGFEALVAENGSVDLELANQALPDLILGDLRMTELDGYGVLKVLHSFLNSSI